MDNIYAASPAVALLVSIVIQYAKNSPRFAWISRDTAQLNAYVSIALATLSGLGLALTFDWDKESGAFSMGFHGNVYDLMHLAAHVPLQWAQQHGIYKLLIAMPEAAGESRAIQRDILAALLGQPPTGQPKPLPKPRGSDVGGVPMEK